MVRLEFSSEELGEFSYWHLALVSVFELFLELLMVRWASSEISVFAYFKNFVLIACFLGFGWGCYLSRRPVNLAVMMVPLVALALICGLPWRPLREIVDKLPAMIGASSQVNFWGVPDLPLNLSTLAVLIAALSFIVPVFCLITFVFVPIGQIVGWLLENANNGIFAYTVNVIGSLLGIVLYTLLCFLWLPPSVWFGVAGVMMVALLYKLPKPLPLAALIGFSLCVGLTSLGASGNGTVYWSPYQKLILRPLYDTNGQTVSYELKTNSNWYQQIYNLSPAFVDSHRNYFQDEPAK